MSLLEQVDNTNFIDDHRGGKPPKVVVKGKIANLRLKPIKQEEPEEPLKSEVITTPSVEPALPESSLPIAPPASSMVIQIDSGEETDFEEEVDEEEEEVEEE